MSKSVRIRRGTSIDHSQFAGAEGEITVDTTIDTIRVHDGITLGGWPVLNAAKNSEVTADILTTKKIYFRNSFANQFKLLHRRKTFQVLHFHPDASK